MQWRLWAHDHGLALLHGSTVAENGRAVTLAGSSGAGKSTSALTCALAGMDLLGDDACVVDPRAPERVYSIYGRAKLETDSAARARGHRGAAGPGCRLPPRDGHGRLAGAGRGRRRSGRHPADIRERPARQPALRRAGAWCGGQSSRRDGAGEANGIDRRRPRRPCGPSPRASQCAGWRRVLTRPTLSPPSARRWHEGGRRRGVPEDHRLLVQAACLPDRQHAAEAWRAWRKLADFDLLDDPTTRLLPALARRSWLLTDEDDDVQGRIRASPEQLGA